MVLSNGNSYARKQSLNVNSFVLKPKKAIIQWAEL